VIRKMMDRYVERHHEESGKKAKKSGICILHP
jgi:hypothetical protein